MKVESEVPKVRLRLKDIKMSIRVTELLNKTNFLTLVSNDAAYNLILWDDSQNKQRTKLGLP